MRNTMRKHFTSALMGFAIITGISATSYADDGAGLRYFFQQSGQISSSIPYGNNTKAGRYALSGDARIYYETYGEGIPFVVLHGGGLGSSYEMGAFIDRLKENFKVIAVSTRGHGRSEIGHTPFTLKQRADDIKAVLSDAGISDAVMIIGFSDGGYAGYAMAAYYPDMVRKLITIGAGEVLQSNRRFVFSLDEWKSYDPAFIEQQRKLMPEPERWNEMLIMYENMWNGAVISKDLFSRITAPVLVMGGDRDINSPMLTEIAAYQQLQNAQLSIIPNAPHACFLANFDAVWNAIVPFIADGD